MSEALQKTPKKDICGICKASRTVYGSALKGIGRQYETFWDWDSGAVIYFGAVGWTITFCGLLTALMGFFMGGASFWWMPLSLALQALFSPPLLVRYYRRAKEIAKILADPVLRFVWVVAKAADVHELRVRAYNNLLKGVELGVTKADGKALEDAREFLLRSEEFLEREVKICNYAIEGKEIADLADTEKSGLFDSLAELADEERTLMVHIASMGPGGDSPVAKILDNETSRLELEAELQGLLPAKTR